MEKSPPSPRRQQVREALAVEVERIYDDEKSRIGSPRIAKRLNKEGYHDSQHKVASIMKARG